MTSAERNQSAIESSFSFFSRSFSALHYLTLVNTKIVQRDQCRRTRQKPVSMSALSGLLVQYLHSVGTW